MKQHARPELKLGIPGLLQLLGICGQQRLLSGPACPAWRPPACPLASDIAATGWYLPAGHVIFMSLLSRSTPLGYAG